MRTEQAWLVVAGAVALVAVLVAVLSWRSARVAGRRADELAARIERLEAAAARPAADVPAPPAEDGPRPPSYVITGLDRPPDRSTPAPAGPAERIDGRLFADIVARETVVRAASLTHGVRRALSPESRNRIRFQVRQQAKQSRRERRAEVREALRHYRARHRADDGAGVRADEGDAA